MKIVCALLLTALTLWSVTSGVALAAVAEQPAEAVETFDIWEYQVEGNTMLPQEDVERAVYGHLGEGKSIADVNDAQKQLETLYHERGFGSVLVDVPEQDVQNGVVKLKVTEGRVGRMQVTGSRYFSLGRIKSKLPSLASGEVPNLSQVQKELATLAQMSRDRTITPVLKPSRTPGKLDVELKVKDTLPLHGSLELNDRYSADTTHLRLNAALHYDNLWQREHSIGIAYQVSPEASDEVEVYSANYLWRFEDSDHLLALYGVKSNTNVATIGTLGVIGSGVIGGARYIVPLTAFDGVYHSLSLGADYKDFDEQIGFDQGGTVVTPISYLKFSAGLQRHLRLAPAAEPCRSGVQSRARWARQHAQGIRAQALQGQTQLRLPAGHGRQSHAPAGRRRAVRARERAGVGRPAHHQRAVLGRRRRRRARLSRSRASR
jgi:hemolysin activation/secretion protein